MKSTLTAAVALAAALFVLPASAAEMLPDGVYDCYLGMAFFGNIKIDGDTFGGPALDGNYEGFYPFEVTDGGTVNWGGPLGALSSDGNKVVATVIKDRGGRPGFDITLQNGSGNFQSIICDPQ